MPPPPQVLDVIAPPYTSDFVQLFLPILENDSIAGTIKTEGEHDPVAEFIGRGGARVPLPRGRMSLCDRLWLTAATFFLPVQAHCKSNFILVN